MKKIIVTFIIICGMMGGIFSIMTFDFNSSAAQQEFLVVNNENHVFDDCFAEDSYAMFSVPSDNPAIPFEDFSTFEALDSVDQVYPYYPLTIRSDEDNMQTLRYWTKDKNNTQNLTMPIEDEYDDGTPYLWKEFPFKVVTDYEQFYKVHENTVNEIFLERFDSESDVYISDFLYEQLQIEENENQLFIEVPVSVPVVVEMKDEVFDGKFEYQHYTPVVYEVVNVVLEVQGVINQSNADVRWCQNGIVVPYELTKNIFESVDQSSYPLADNQTYWKPNAYIVKCNEGIDRKTFASEAIANNESFYLEVYDYGLGKDPFFYLYTKEDVLTWPEG